MLPQTNVWGSFDFRGAYFYAEYIISLKKEGILRRYVKYLEKRII